MVARGEGGLTAVRWWRRRRWRWPTVALIMLAVLTASSAYRDHADDRADDWPASAEAAEDDDSSMSWDELFDDTGFGGEGEGGTRSGGGSSSMEETGGWRMKRPAGVVHDPILRLPAGRQQRSVFSFEEESERHPRIKRTFKPVDPDNPINILVPFPKNDSSEQGRNPFRLSIPKMRPLFDIALENVYNRSLVPRGSLKTHFKDSRLSDAHGPNVAIDSLVANELDCIMGYAFVYALAPVARMSPFWHNKDSNGIPIITTIGNTANLDDRQEYQLLTRIASPYKILRLALFEVFKFHDWKRATFLFHDYRSTGGPSSLSIPVSECFLLMASIRTLLKSLSPIDHNYYMFNEDQWNRTMYEEKLKVSSFVSNGAFFSFSSFS